MNATCVLLRLESNWTNTCWVRLNHMWWCFLSNWGRIQFLTTMIGRICQLPKWYTSESEAQILFSKFSNKTHCCLHWLLRQESFPIDQYQYVIFFLQTNHDQIWQQKLYFSLGQSYTLHQTKLVTQCVTHINCVGGGFEHNTASLVMILMSWLSYSG